MWKLRHLHIYSVGHLNCPSKSEPSKPPWQLNWLPKATKTSFFRKSKQKHSANICHVLSTVFLTMFTQEPEVVKIKVWKYLAHKQIPRTFCKTEWQLLIANPFLASVEFINRWRKVRKTLQLQFLSSVFEIILSRSKEHTRRRMRVGGEGCNRRGRDTQASRTSTLRQER